MNSFTNWSYRLVCCVVLTWALASPSVSAPARVETHTATGKTVISVNGVPVLSVSHAKAGAQRAEVVAARLKSLAAREGKPNFHASKTAGEYRVYAHGLLIASPTHDDAVQQGVTRRVLAHRWAAHLVRAWNTPFLRLSPGGVVVGEGARRRLTIGGKARGPLSVQVEPKELASARLDGGTVILEGKTSGRGFVTITRSGAVAKSAILVMKPAGAVQPVQVEVTGRQVPRTLLEDIVDTELRRSIRLEPGCWSVIRQRPIYPAMWTRGDTLSRTVTVRLAGPGFLATTREVPITIRRTRLPKTDNVTLFYSNNPESVTEPRVLFRHPVKQNHPARVLYHHQNKAKAPLDLSLDLVNTGDSEAKLQVVDSSSPALVDTVLAGHRATTQYLKRSQDDVGIILRIPPGARRRLWTRTMSSGATLSGLMLVRTLTREPLQLSLSAEDPRGRTAAVATNEDTETVFPSPDKTIEAHYTVGGPWAHVPIGRFAISNQNGKRLSGNYGVVYSVRLHLNNPTSRQRTVRVIFEAQAGAARGAFLIDGALTETPETHPPAETRVATVSLSPHEKKTLTIITMPAAGSAYPAGLIVNAP